MASVSTLSPLIVAVALLPWFLTVLSSTTQSDREALLCLKHHLSTDPTTAVFATWKSSNSSNSFCGWRGVTCTGLQPAPRVAALDLEGQGLAGQIPLCISNLTSLTSIHLPNNRLTGRVPPELGQLAGLQYLNLSFNMLNGTIPTTLSLCPGLQVIALKNNFVGGEIPPGLSTLLRLSSLDLTSNNLIGKIPPLLGSSSPLEYVRLSNNLLSGEIPPYLSNCSTLRYLTIANNSLQGGIPPTLFNSSSIRVIDLQMNNLSGPIPPFTKLSSPLQYLRLSVNSLTGTIPPSIGNLSSLIKLLISQNNLQGSIPESLSSASASLQILDLTYNSLSGTVPRSIYNFSSLFFLGLGNNILVGQLPSDMGYTLPNLHVLMMSENQFEGQIPASIANASNLDTVFLANNSFSGVIPSFGSLQNLESLVLYLNQLEAGDWSFLSALTNCTHLTRLNLAGNNIRGDLPSSITNLSINLEVLDLGSNNITGTLPSEIGNLVNLSVLYLGQNMLTGHIPSSLGHLRNLIVLSLSRNKFFGEIPPSIGNLDKLTELYLQENDLSGNIPKDLAGCRNLLALNLSSNALNGSIPTQLFGSLNQLSWYLDVSHNQLTHSIPLEIGGLINLGFLNISHNKLSGTIPSTLDACVRLESLRMEGNLLEGSIPQSLVNLKGVKEADFSQNNLSGEIPEFFESFTALKYLNLSFNDFEGQVPTGGVFAANASRVFVQGNPRLCAKYPMLQLPLCPTSRSKRKHKFLVPIVATVSIVAALAFLLVLFFLAVNVCKKRRSKANHLFHHSRMEFRKLSYGDLSKATNGFSSTNLVGSGWFGMVYKGKLDAEANSVAVKVFKLDQLGVSSSFITECKALRSTRHRNLVKVITACSAIDPMGNDFKALVFEYMANGSLESRLHTKIQSYGHLSLGTRICTAVDIACALDYLHNRCIPPVVHCDLKPSNILFDDGNVACVCDFGQARFIHGSSSGGYNSSTSLVGPRGSVGYIAPEYGMGSKISAEGDVYSYGIVLLEMLTRKRPTDELFRDGLTLHGFVEASFPQIGEVLDPDLIAEMSGGHAGDTSEVEEYHTAARMQSCVVQLLRLGLLCSQESPKDRPMIQDIYREVTAIKEAFFSA